MIEINAKLLKGPVYLTGETVECSITFNYPKEHLLKTAHSSIDSVETLAWSSAQIHCLCTTSNKVNTSEASPKLPTQVAGPDSESGHSGKEDTNSKPKPSRDTSFAPFKTDSGSVVFSTKPKILFCDLRLAIGESKTFVYKETLPNELPPSYRGQAVKYSYKITIGTQRVNSPIRLLRVPFRVLVLNVDIPESSPCGDSEDLTPSNPFLETRQKETSVDIALQMLQNVTARRSPNFYNITNGRGKVVRFCLFKQAFKLGEDIVGTFDFSEATVNCVQYSVTLQSEEEVAEPFRANLKQNSAVISYNKHHETCIGWAQTQLVLPIPLHVTPAFSTQLVSLQWRLHFEFVTTVTQVRAPPLDASGREDKKWHGPEHIDIETMVWNLPLKILATNSQIISQGAQAPPIYNLSL